MGVSQICRPGMSFCSCPRSARQTISWRLSRSPFNAGSRDDSADALLRSSEQDADPAQLPGTLSWIGESALGVSAAAALSEANVDAVDALLYLGQREQHYERIRRLVCQCRSCRGSKPQPDSEHAEMTAAATWPRVQPAAPCVHLTNGSSAEASTCLWLPIKAAKLDKHGLDRQLMPALRFISVGRSHGRSVLICDDDGADACVCVALAAILCRGVDLEHCEPSSGGRNISAVIHGVKAAARTHLADISSFHPSAKPSRTALKQVYSFVGGLASAQRDTRAFPCSRDAR